MGEQQNVSADFVNSMVFSGEAHLYFDAFVNRRNCGIADLENLRMLVKKKHSGLVTVWCEFWSEGITGPFFYENVADNANSKWSKTTQFCVSQLKNIAFNTG